MDFLKDYGSALAALVTALATIMLSSITYLYMKHTRRMADVMEKDTNSELGPLLLPRLRLKVPVKVEMA